MSLNLIVNEGGVQIHQVFKVIFKCLVVMVILNSDGWGGGGEGFGNKKKYLPDSKQQWTVRHTENTR